MCGELNRLVTLQALKNYLEEEVARLGKDASAGGELRRRLDELAVVNDELTSLLANPRLAVRGVVATY